MKKLTILLITLLTVMVSTSNATINSELMYPIVKQQIINQKLTYPFHLNLNKKNIDVKDWMNWVQYCSKRYGVDPYFALAVAETESSNSWQRYRFGKMGKTFYGPFGIHKCFLKKWTIDNVYVNTEVGIRALSRYGNQKKALKKYNASFNMAYYKRIKHLENRNRQNKVFQSKHPDLLVYKTK